MNYKVMCETEDYGLSENTKYYANLFQTTSRELLSIKKKQEGD